MSEKEFERYLKMLGGLLGLNRQQREAIADELRDHFDERLTELLAGGLSHDDAVTKALEEFGDAAGMAQQFVEVAHLRKKKRVFRVTAFSIGSLAAGILLLLAMWPENARVPLTRTIVANVDEAQIRAANDKNDKELSEADRSVLKALESQTRAVFLDTPLPDVTEFLEKESKIPIVVERKSLEAAGINPDVSVTLDTSDTTIRLSSALNLILHEQNLDWYVEDGTLVIVSSAQLKETMQTQVYDVSDLMQIGEASSEITWEAFSSLIERHTGGREVEWSENGGLGSIVPAVEGVMVVSHHAKAHAEIAEFLRALRKVRDSKEKPGAELTKPVAVHQFSKAEADIHEKLSAKIAPFEFLDTPLGDVIAYFKIREKVNILLDHKSLHEQGIAVDSSVTAHVRNEPTLRMALARILKEHSLVPVVQNDALLITTVEHARQLLTTRLYSLHDLLSADPEVARTEVEKFVNLITTTTGSPRQNWTEFGGSNVADGVASLKVLAITSTAETHDEIERVMDGIRRSRKSATAHSKPKPDDKVAAASVTQRVYFLSAGGEAGSTHAEAKELGKAITDLLAIEIGADVNQVQVTALSDRLVIRAPAAIHRRLDKMATNELSGLLNTDSVLFGRTTR